MCDQPDRDVGVGSIERLSNPRVCAGQVLDRSLLLKLRSSMASTPRQRLWEGGGPVSDKCQFGSDETWRTCTNVDIAETGIGAGADVLATLLSNDADAGQPQGRPNAPDVSPFHDRAISRRQHRRRVSHSTHREFGHIFAEQHGHGSFIPTQHGHLSIGIAIMASPQHHINGSAPPAV